MHGPYNVKFTVICLTEPYIFISYTSDIILSHSHIHVLKSISSSACKNYLGKNLPASNMKIFFLALFIAKLKIILPARLFGQNVGLLSAHQIAQL